METMGLSDLSIDAVTSPISVSAASAGSGVDLDAQGQGRVSSAKTLALIIAVAATAPNTIFWFMIFSSFGNRGLYLFLPCGVNELLQLSDGDCGATKAG